MAVSTWLAIQQPPSLMRGAPGKELAELNPSCGKISERTAFRPRGREVSA